MPNSAAAKAKLQVNDIIVGVAGKLINDPETLVNTIQRYKPGEMVTKAPEKMMEEDPFEPTGFRRGNFLFKPAAEVSTGFDSNAARLPNGHGSPFVVVGSYRVLKTLGGSVPG